MIILYHCWGRSAPWAKRAPGNRDECAPPLNLTQIDNLLRTLGDKVCFQYSFIGYIKLNVCLKLKTTETNLDFLLSGTKYAL